MSTARVDFTRGAAERIARAVRIVEQGERDQTGPQYGRVVESGGSSIRLGTIDATWSKGATATVTQINGDGSAIDNNPTFTARNWFATVTVSGCTKKVACANVRGTWLLISAECD